MLLLVVDIVGVDVARVILLPVLGADESELVTSFVLLEAFDFLVLEESEEEEAAAVGAAVLLSSPPMVSVIIPRSRVMALGW